MTSNQERREKYAQKKEKQVVWKDDQFQAVPVPDSEPPPTVTIKDAEPQPQKTLVDKMRAKFAPDSEHKPESVPTKQSTTRGKPKPNLMLTVFPGMVATFISTFLTDVYKDPYKPCAPTKDESLLIITPLFEEISRAIKVTGKIDQTTENLLNCVAMLALYGARAYQTYVQIKQKEKDNGNKAGTSTATSTKTANEYISGTDTRTIRPDTVSVTSPNAEGNGNSNASIGEESDTGRREREAALIHDMLKRDVEGRIRLGVLPARIRDDSGDANK